MRSSSKDSFNVTITLLVLSILFLIDFYTSVHFFVADCAFVFALANAFVFALANAFVFVLVVKSNTALPFATFTHV